MLKKIMLAWRSVSICISDLKRNPQAQAVIDDAQEEAISLLNRNKPTANIIPAENYEMLMEIAEDIELAGIIEQRKTEKPNAIEIDLDEL